jgi:urease subunit beta
MPKSQPSARVGGLVLADEPVEINAGRPTVTLAVRNTGDRPIQVGSHFHFFETNPALEFDRGKAFGMRLDIPASTGIRFEPGDQKTVTLVPFGGNRRAFGFNNLVDGWTGGEDNHGYRPALDEAMARAASHGFRHASAPARTGKGR